MAAPTEPASVEIVAYDDRFAADFARLNREWLEGFGLLEPADLKYLDAPRETILAPGGAIFIAVRDGITVGTCAVAPLSLGVVEMVKLAVTPSAQGHGLGRRLALAALDHARKLGAAKVVLTSNHNLVAAIRLYESLGFAHRPIPKDVPYASVDVYMELELERAEQLLA